MQTKAFVLYPAAFDRDDRPVDLVGAEEVNRKIREWIATARALDQAGVGAPTAAVKPEAELPSVLRGSVAGD
jgi:hypothetical protein